MKLIVRVPATSANLGPGFDALGLALDLWNETEFASADNFSMQVEGEGAGGLAPDQKNLIVRSAQKVYDVVRQTMPALAVRCLNHIPFGSGLGSSAAAALSGLLGANALLDTPLSNDEILNLAVEIEGHPDNVAPALLGGLIAATMDEGKVIAHKIVGASGQSALRMTVVLPNFHFPTQPARAVLPKQISMKDAVHNIGRAVLVADALRTGDLGLLGRAMEDALHQPYRLPLIPGASEAMQAAKKMGAAAVALSGAGPGLIAFSGKADPTIGEAMKRTFESAGLNARVFELAISEEGAKVEIGD